MDHMESSSVGDVKPSNDDTKEVGTNSDGSFKIATDAAENITPTHMEIPDEVSEGCDDDSTLLEDVNVCDTCGDVGHENLLATCSKCSDGAEHIYCMRVRLQKVPDTDWICEDCVLSELKDNRRETRCSNFAVTLKHNKDELDQEVEASGTSNVKVNPISDLKVLDIDKKRREKFSCQPSFKRPLGNVQSALLTRRRARGLDNVLTSRQYSKAPKSQEVSAKSNNELSSKDLLGTRLNADVLTSSSQIFPKSQQLPTSSGLLTKSKSFSGSDRRRKVQFLEKGPDKQKFLRETAAGTKGKNCAFRSLKKSLSFNDGSAGHSYSLDAEPKTITPKHSVVSDTRRLRPMKECASDETEVKPVLKKPRILSPSGLSSVSSSEKKFGTHCEPISTNVSGTKCSDIKTSQKLNESGTANADEKKSATKSNPSEEQQRNKGEVTSSSLLSFRGHHSCVNATGQAKLPALERSSHQNQKAPQSSHSRLNNTMNCQTEDNSSVSANDMGIEKDLNKSGGDLAPSPLYYHLNTDRSSAIPLFNYLWKGEFQLQSNQKLPGVLSRIQAHLSTQSSSKIPEVVKKFPGKILLEEVPRLSTWPTQFLKDQPQDDSIGLYFFAQDIESYAKYKSFLQCMIDYDLALKGNFDGIELLIFSSKLLPEKSQCWNKLLFLWGIFKQRKFVAT